MNVRRILLVEDSPDDVELTLTALRDNNITNDVVVATDGARALDYLLDAASPLPAVTLLDLNLPKVDGLEVLRRLRTEPRTRTAPVVMLTSSQQEADVLGSYDFGANAYIRKPIGFAEFAEAVRILGLFWVIHNQPPVQSEHA